ncbi:hypothetical protein FOA52_004505 [Chlamydomonas sp. UWO 241]|nr:hypothetical protein FOA52_004505 [Chlamydomonas sp. UWO 241]
MGRGKRKAESEESESVASSSASEDEDEETEVPPSSSAPERSTNRAARTTTKKQVTYAEEKYEWEKGNFKDEKDGKKKGGGRISRVGVEGKDAACHACKNADDDNKLLSCEACPHMYHTYCLVPSLARMPRGDWYCPDCTSLLGLLEVERFLDVRDIVAAAPAPAAATEGDAAPSAPSSGAEEGAAASSAAPAAADGAGGKEYYVKWLERSFMHCSWVAEEKLQAAMKVFKTQCQGIKARLATFWRQRGDAAQPQDNEQEETGEVKHGVNSAWLLVDRIVAERPCEEERGGLSSELLVKWRDLGYDVCTWEHEADLPAFAAEIARFRGWRPIKEEAAERSAAAAGGKAGKGGKGKGKGGSEGDDAAHTSASNPRLFDETPSFLKEGGSLHPYQLEGLNWMYHKWQQKDNVILADEMGLGKTVQSIALLAALFRTAGCVRPHMVVVPLSTIRNWEREFDQWAPFLNVVVMIGNQKARKVIIDHELYEPPPPGARKNASLQDRVKFHVLLTSYEMVLAEAGPLSKLEYEVMVVDEGHRLKNNKSRLFVELQELTAHFKVLLTGTPLQNNLTELYMLLHFLEPEKFKQEDFEESEIGHEEQVATLHQQLSPHILRRLKKDVLKGLPPKLEQIVRVELSGMQRELYRSLLARHLPVLAGGAKDGGRPAGGANVTAMKNLVMQLRKACNHPYLFPGMESFDVPTSEHASALVADSGKVALLDRMLERLITGGHRTLVYSQFTSMLDILEDWLKARGWGYQRIDGSVPGPERQRRIDRFNTLPDANPIFLLSTRAGGVGINLATADTVIIYDSDWNPHNDLQAMARAHRMGQTRPVMMYRLVTRMTVEERMIQTSKKKLLLEHLVVRKMGRGGEGGGGALKQSELDDILRYGARELFADDDPAAAAATAAAAAAAKDKDKQPSNGGAGDSSGTAGGASAPPEAGSSGSGGDGGAARATGVEPAGSSDAAAGPSSAPAAAAAAAPKPGGSQRIVWDDTAVDALLDRTELIARVGVEEEEDDDGDDMMKAFKVANFQMREEADDDGTADKAAEPDVDQLLQEVCPDQGTAELPSAAFWDNLLADRHAHMRASELMMLGRGKRKRTQVQYFEVEDAGGVDGSGKKPRRPGKNESDDDFEGSGDEERNGSSSDGSMGSDPDMDEFKRRTGKGSKGAAKDLLQAGGGASGSGNGARARAKAGERAREPLPPLQATGRDGQLLVFGFDEDQRATFLATLMRFGINTASGPRGKSLMYAPFVKALEYVQPEIPVERIQAFCNLLINCVSEATDERGVFECGLPLSAVYGAVPRDDVLGRVGFLHLARNKLLEAMTARSFELRAQVAELGGTRAWRSRDDAALLHGVVQHGYGCWDVMLSDGSLGLAAALQSELGVEGSSKDGSAEAAWMERRLQALSIALNDESETLVAAPSQLVPSAPSSSHQHQYQFQHPSSSSLSPLPPHIPPNMAAEYFALKMDIVRMYKQVAANVNTVKDVASNATQQARRGGGHPPGSSPAAIFRSNVTVLDTSCANLAATMPALGTSLREHVLMRGSRAAVGRGGQGGGRGHAGGGLAGGALNLGGGVGAHRAPPAAMVGAPLAAAATRPSHPTMVRGAAPAAAAPATAAGSGGHAQQQQQQAVNPDAARQQPNRQAVPDVIVIDD